MGVSVIGGASSSAQQAVTYFYVDTLNNFALLDLRGLALGNDFLVEIFSGMGFNGFSNTSVTTPATFEVLDLDYSVLANVNTLWFDWDSGNNNNAFRALVRLNKSPSFVKIYTAQAFTASFQKVTPTFKPHIPLTFTKYSTSQSITLTGTRKFLIIGAGGAGGGTNSAGGGGGGGSGYITTGQVSAGTYSLVVGAGGTPVSNNNGTAGGSTTFHTATAAGGSGGFGRAQGGHGGAGGSGGAGGREGSNSSSIAGGTNGGNGTSSPNSNGGVGSGVVLASPWLPPSVAQGFYGGGNSGNKNPGGDIGAGGGGVHNWNTSDIGGPGANGGLIIWDESQI